jgi:uncharacterized membrane protein YhaH (DUF805 family)
LKFAWGIISNGKNRQAHHQFTLEPVQQLEKTSERTPLTREPAYTEPSLYDTVSPMSLVDAIVFIIIYGAAMRRAKGRCARFEYLTKVCILVYTGLMCVLLLGVFFSFIRKPVIAFLLSVILFLLFYQFLKLTARRLYDLDMHVWHLATLIIPVYGISILVYLCIKKGNDDINEYDRAIKYRKLLNRLAHGRNVIDVHSDRIYIADDDYLVEKTDSGNLRIQIMEFSNNNCFSEYLLEHHNPRRDKLKNIIEISETELDEVIDKLKLIYIKGSLYLVVNGVHIFIRKENFAYTIIIKKDSEKRLDTFARWPPADCTETEMYVCRKKIREKDLAAWIKNLTEEPRM